MKANLMFQKEKYEQAISLYRNVLEKTPGTSDGGVCVPGGAVCLGTGPKADFCGFFASHLGTLPSLGPVPVRSPLPVGRVGNISMFFPCFQITSLLWRA